MGVEETKEKEGIRDDVELVHAEGLPGVCWGGGGVGVALQASCMIVNIRVISNENGNGRSVVVKQVKGD